MLITPMWQHDESVELIRKIQPFAHHAGYHLGLAGGVLNVGHSRHDLDIIVMPLDDKTKNRNLKGLWNARHPRRGRDYQALPADSGENDLARDCERRSSRGLFRVRADADA